MSDAAAGVSAAGVVLVLVALTSGRGPAATTVLGCLLAVIVGVRPGRLFGRSTVASRHDGTIRPPPGGAATGALRPDLQVRWWRRDGHDRLYVTDAAGRSLGWLDRDTGALHVLDERDRHAVLDAVSVPHGAGP